MFYIKLVDSMGNYETLEATGYRVDNEYPVESSINNKEIPPRMTISLANGGGSIDYLCNGKVAYIMNNEGKTIEKIGTPILVEPRVSNPNHV